MTRLADMLHLTLEDVAARVATLVPQPVYFDEPITHPSFDGDAFSDVGTSTKIENTSWNKPIPSTAKALRVEIAIRDSGSSGSSGIWFAVGPSSTYYYALVAEANDRPNDTYAYAFGWVPCTDGDLYYQCAASGADTLDAILRVWGYV